MNATKTPLLVASLTMTAFSAAQAPSILIDDFSSGVLDTGSVIPTSSSYVRTFSASEAFSGTRMLDIRATTNSNESDAQVRVDPSAGALDVRVGNGIQGAAWTLTYGRPFVESFQSDLRPTTHVNVIVESSTHPLTLVVGLRGGPGSTTMPTFTSSVLQIPATATPVELSFNLANNFTPEAYDSLFGQAQQLFVQIGNPNSSTGTSDVNARIPSIQAVPEPFSLAALATGVAALGLRRRKR